MAFSVDEVWRKPHSQAPPRFLLLAVRHFCSRVGRSWASLEMWLEYIASLYVSFLPFSSSVLPQVLCSATSSPPWWDMESSTSTFQTDLRAGGHRSHRTLHFKKKLRGGTKFEVLVFKLGKGLLYVPTSSRIWFSRAGKQSWLQSRLDSLHVKGSGMEWIWCSDCSLSPFIFSLKHSSNVHTHTHPHRQHITMTTCYGTSSSWESRHSCQIGSSILPLPLLESESHLSTGGHS